MYQPAPIRHQGAWAVWWLCIVTFGIYYLFWYHRIAGEITDAAGQQRDGTTKWWSQIIPIYGLVALSRTAKRLNSAHERVRSDVRVSPVMTWLWAPIWFASQTRYLQRRINTLATVQRSQAVH